MQLTNIDSVLKDGGAITLGRIGPIRCAAIANDAHNPLAMLVRRRNESLNALLERLDAAIEEAIETEEYIDEING